VGELADDRRDLLQPGLIGGQEAALAGDELMRISARRRSRADDDRLQHAELGDAGHQLFELLLVEVLAARLLRGGLRDVDIFDSDLLQAHREALLRSPSARGPGSSGLSLSFSRIKPVPVPPVIFMASTSTFAELMIV